MNVQAIEVRHLKNAVISASGNALQAIRRDPHGALMNQGAVLTVGAVLVAYLNALEELHGRGPLLEAARDVGIDLSRYFEV